MTLRQGTSLGPYEIMAPLGAGGMGEVYKAKDTRLDRFVAIKVLPEHLAKHPDSLARFEREAKAVAALNHPAITALFDIGHEGETVYAVMELLEGQSLRAVLQSGPLPPRRATELAIQMARGLAAAHEKGLVHRDLKPENLWITTEGRLKILDFGLAKQLVSTPSGAHSHLPTEAMGSGLNTEKGMILGTMGYMSPEQVRGEAVDPRSDLFSFGVVLFEMLTGKKAFARDTASETMAAILRDEPQEGASSGSALPLALRRIIDHCLEKAPAARFRDAHDLAFALGNASGTSEAPLTHAPAFLPRRRWATWALGGATALLLVGVGWAGASYRGLPKTPLRKLLLPVQDLRLSIPTPPMLSPDGRRIAYAAGGGLWVRDLDQVEARQVVEGGRPTYFTWSPDSAELAFISEGKLHRIGAEGGTPTQVGRLDKPLGGTTPGLAWLADGRIALAPASNGTALYAIPAQGGEFTELLTRDMGTESDFHKPSVLPEGRGLLYVVDRNLSGANALEVLHQGKRKEVFRVPDSQGEVLDAPVYAPSGHILFHRTFQNPGIWALPFSLSRLEATGPAFILVPGARWPSVSRDGSLLYCTGEESKRQVVVVDRARKVTPVSAASAFAQSPVFSPEGGRIAWTDWSIFVADLRQGRTARLTFGNDLDLSPAWSPGGERLIFTTRRGGSAGQIASVLANGGGAPSLVPMGGPSPSAGPVETHYAPSVSRDGRWILFTKSVPVTQNDIFALDQTQGGKVVPVLSVPGSQARPTLSPDGRFLLYHGDETGQSEVHLRSFPGGEGHWQVSPQGGRYAHWGAKGDRIYYQEGETLMEVEVSFRQGLSISPPKAVFKLSGNPSFVGDFDVSPDGRTFAMVQELHSGQDPLRAMTLVENWAQELTRRSTR